MKMNKRSGELKVAIASLGVLALTLQGCGKYEDGPAFSLQSKTKRLVGDWYMQNASLFQELELILEFEKDGDFTLEQVISYSGYDPYSAEIEGSWEWEDGYEAVILSYEDEGENEQVRWEIKRLTKDELSFSVPYGFSSITYELEKQ